MQRRLTFRDRFGHEIVAIPRAAASPEELSRAIDARDARWLLDALFPGGEQRGFEHHRLLQRIADVPAADTRLYSMADLKALIIRRVGRTGPLMMLRATP